MALKPLKDIPEWWELCARYRYDIYAFAVEALGVTPTWQQELLFESIQFDGSRTSVASGHGCFGKGTKIRLANGKWKRVEKITINDAVMGTDGFSPREVIKVVQGYQELYQFEYANGSKHVYNKSHILCLVSLETKNGWKAGDTIEVLVSKYLEWPEETKRQFAAYELKHRKFQPVKINNVTALGEGDYYGFVLDGDATFLTADGMVHHNTGKTASAGIVALWHLLFFDESITMFTAPQIGQLKNKSGKKSV
jgi:hypothetical protein